ncbi:MAG: sulfotransferase domain-containing protein, partial [Pseudomonadota bacterium]
MRPAKTRDIQNAHLESTYWNDFPFREGDIVINTYAKSGTTWMQQIVSQLIFDGRDDLTLPDLSPWIDMVLPPIEEKLEILEKQDHQRFVKSHLPVDAIVFSEKARYIYVARDGRDVLWSLHNHHINANDFYYERINERPGRVGPPFPRANPDISAYFDHWLANDGEPFWSFFDSVKTWWDIRDLDNVLLVHFADLKTDLEAGILRVADFLDIEVKSDLLPTIVTHCGFDYMKTHATRVAPRNG